MRKEGQEAHSVFHPAQNIIALPTLEQLMHYNNSWQSLASKKAIPSEHVARVYIHGILILAAARFLAFTTFRVLCTQPPSSPEQRQAVPMYRP